MVQETTVAHISLNQFAEFSTATKAAKARIIKQQIKADKLLIPWYQGAKGSIKKYLKDVNDFAPIETELERQKTRSIETKRQRTDREVSIQALQRLIEMNLSRLFGNINYEVVKLEVKSIVVNGVQINISPEIVIKATIDGKVMYGGVKIHICKTKPFDLQQCNYVAILLHDFLLKITGEDEHVLPQFCICIDVFGDRIVSAKEKHIKESREIRNICNEILEMWPKAA